MIKHVALSWGAGFDTLANTSGSGANSLLTWLVEVWENKWPLLNEVKMIGLLNR